MLLVECRKTSTMVKNSGVFIPSLHLCKKKMYAYFSLTQKTMTIAVKEETHA